MGRSLEFDPEEAVFRAMEVFWCQGYEATSIGDLEAGTAVGRKSLYRAFRDKHALFLRCLEAYRSFMGEQNLSALQRPGAGLAEIEALFRSFASMAGSEMAARGCFIANTALELAASDAEAAREVQLYFAQIRSAFTNALQGAVARGEISADTPVAREANFFVGVIQSLSVMARAGCAPEVLSDVIESALARLR